MSSDGSGYAQAAGAVAVAAIQASIATSVANKQYNIGDRQLKIAEFLNDTWKVNHLPCELKLLAEVCAEPTYVPKYDMVSLRASNDVAIAFGRSKADARRNMSVYSVGGFQALERQFGVGQALAEADAIAAARRREDGRADIKKQQSIENRHRAAALGRGMLDQSGGAMKAASAAFSTGGSTIASAVNSGAQLMGWLSRRNFDSGNTRTVNDTPDGPNGAQGALAYVSRNGFIPDTQTIPTGATWQGVSGKPSTYAGDTMDAGEGSMIPEDNPPPIGE
jgi:hypothetical protein